MAQLPLDQAIPRFKANEERIDVFANGADTAEVTPSSGLKYPSLRKLIAGFNSQIASFISTKNTEINTNANGILAGAQAARDAAAASKTAAANSAAASADSAAESANYAAILNTQVGRTRLAGNVTYSVPGTFADINTALWWVANKIDGCGFDVTIELAAGDKVLTSTIWAPAFVGLRNITLKGLGATPSATMIKPAAGITSLIQWQTPLNCLMWIQNVGFDCSNCIPALGCYQTNNVILKDIHWRITSGNRPIMMSCTSVSTINCIGAHTYQFTGGTNIIGYSSGDNSFITLEPGSTHDFTSSSSAASLGAFFESYHAATINCSGAFTAGNKLPGRFAAGRGNGTIDYQESTGVIPGGTLPNINDGTANIIGFGGKVFSAPQIASLVNFESRVPVTSGTWKAVASITLPPGDWLVSGAVGFSFTDGTTRVFWLQASMSLSFTSGVSGLTLSGGTGVSQNFSSAGQLLTGQHHMVAMPTKMSFSEQTSVYLMANGGYENGVLSACGCISAQQLR